MNERPHRKPSLAFLVAAWLLFSAMLSWRVAEAIAGRQATYEIGFVALLWVGITGLIVRRLRPRSRVALVFPETIHGARLDASVRGGLTLLVTLFVAVLVVATALHLGWWR